MNERIKKKIRCLICGRFAKHLCKDGELIGGRVVTMGMYFYLIINRG